MFIFDIWNRNRNDSRLGYSRYEERKPHNGRNWGFLLPAVTFILIHH